MATRNIVLLSWDEPSKAYEAFSKFRDLDVGGVEVDQATVVERGTDGGLRIKDGQDNVIGVGTLGGGTLGMLVGILGGPLGVLLGAASGGLIGSLFDLDRADGSDSVIGEMGRAVPPGSTALVAEVTEADPAGLDAYAASAGARLLRRPEDEVLDEISAAEDAADAAAAAADAQVREAKKAERKKDREERIAKFKARFQHAQTTSAD